MDDGQREGRVDVEVVVKGVGSAVLLDDVVNIYGGGFVRIGGFHFDSAYVFQPLGIGEGDTRYPGTMPAGIDADDKFAPVVIVVKFMVKPFHCGKCLWVFHKRVNDGEAIGQFAGIVKLPVKSNDLV